MSVTGFMVDGQIQKYDYGSLDNLPDIPENSGTFWATYNSTSEAEITDAFSNNKSVMMKHGNDIFSVMRKLSIGPSGSAWLFVSVGETNIRTTWVSGNYWNSFSTNTMGGEISNNLKQALLQLASKVAYVDEYGQTYYNDLYDALYPKELMSISATFNQGSNIIYDIDPLTVLNQYLTVVANYSDGTTETIPSSNYTLSGNLLEGVSTITVYYEEFTDTFNVNVTHMAGYYTIVNNLTGCTTNNPATAIQENTSYTAIITASAGYTLSGATVTITMGGNILTGVFSNGTISIPNVTGNLVITVVASAVTLSSIIAVYTQSGTVYDTDTLDSLKDDLVVTATYSDSSTQIVPASDYTLSGTLTAGTSTITVSYGGKTTTFTVMVTAEPLVPSEYQQIEYVQRPNGSGVGVYANTGVTLSGIGDVVVNADFMQTIAGPYSNYIVGIRVNIVNTNTNGLVVGINSTEDGLIAWSGDSASLSQASTTVNRRINVTATFTGSNCSITDGEATATSAEYEPVDYSNQPICIFGRKKTTSQVSDAFSGNCYYIKITEGGVTKVELIPCTRKSDDAVGFWNRANSTFVTNASFVAGPTV